jgi:shikimate dehydrogenase
MTSPRCGVLGRPIDHSLSPVLHRAAYAHLGLDWDYQAYDVGAGELEAFLQGLGPEWVGLSLTMPLKHEALALAATTSSTSDLAGGANTLILADAGPEAHNTDVPGLVAALDDAGADRGPAVVLGTGATARSAVVALGRRGVESIAVIGRRAEALTPLLALGERLGVPISVRTGDVMTAREVGAALVVSTIPAAAADALVPDPTGTGWYFDALYAPWPTPVAQRWRGPVIGGLSLLVHQAALQVRLMTGREVPVEVLRAAGEQALAARRGTPTG